MSEMIKPSFETMAFLGEKAKDQVFITKVNETANKINRVLNPVDANAQRQVNGNSAKIINELANDGEWKCDNVIRLVETANNPTPTVNAEVARQRLDILANSTYIAMKHGDNVELQDALGTNDGAIIDAVLPESMRGIGPMVAEIAINREITSPELRDALKKLDRRAGVLSAGGGAGEEKLRELIGDRILELSELADTLDDKGYEELTRVSAFLGAEVEKMEGGGVITELQKVRKLNEERIAQKRKEEEKYAELRKRSLEQARYETFQAMLLHKNPITLDVFQQYAPEWMREEKDKPLMQTLVALANSCFYKWKYGDTNLDVMVDPRGEATFNAPNEMMQKMYEIPGVRQTMESIVRNYFEPGEEVGLDKDDKKREVFVLRLRGTKNGNVDRVVSQAQNIGDEQTKLVDDLIRQGIEKSDAMLAVSTAFNLLYVGHIFEDADINRELNPCDAYVEQMRAFIFPATKARSKFGLNKDPITEKSGSDQKESVGTEEGWGGQLGQWLTEVVIRARHKVNQGVGENDPDVRLYRQYQRGEICPFPKRLFASFFTLTEVDVKVKNDSSNKVETKRMSLAEALYRGETIDFETKTEKGNKSLGVKGVNPWGSYYDVSDSANKLYKIVKGDQKAYPLPLGDMRALQQVANWAHEVSDARNKVKGKDILRPHVEGREFMKWIIAACVQGGIFPHSAELVLMTPDVKENQDVSFDGLLKRRDLLEKEEDKRWLKKEFHAENYGSKFIRSRIIKAIGKNRRRY
ncbi:MAG TPA: hypothetical protein PK045_01175 [Candidatus Woesebacteria bacterium]|mgnify:CR=1 FL=1|nr:hypothetical protein [Candidatus Woesebacteria bacterium]